MKPFSNRPWSHRSPHCPAAYAQGCRVLGLDPDATKCALAEDLGVSTLNLSSEVDVVGWCLAQTGGVGVDGVLITASTSSSEPVHVAAQVCRQRGRIVLVGVTGLELRRDLFYKKELSFQVSCSYGPGRYDHAYEHQGHDYPIGFVRWTEQRNFQAVLHALSTGALRTDSLISHRFPIDQAAAAYDLLSSPEPHLGILLQYPGTADPEQSTIALSSKQVLPPSPDVWQVIPLVVCYWSRQLCKPCFDPGFRQIRCQLPYPRSD